MIVEEYLYFEFADGPCMTSISDDELLTGIELPPPPPGLATAFAGVSRRRGILQPTVFAVPGGMPGRLVHGPGQIRFRTTGDKTTGDKGPYPAARRAGSVTDG